MSAIQFRLAARTDAAGKYNPNAPWEGNEDNMFVDSDLAKDNLGEFTTDKVVNVSDRGCLMVVADGMGGMNAGEVASAIAIKTVMEHFTPERLTDAICKDSKTRIRYLETVVVAADSAIKKDSRNNPDHEGMGSTIILAWLCDDEICLTWCGDSRAYLFHPDTGLAQVSKDHSYVQGLVDDGKITEIEAFDHPYGNIITRSLGDPDKKAKPESKCFKVEKGDVFMLCSDGLSGVLRDRKTYDEEGRRLDSDNLEDIIAEHRKSMTECIEFLYEAAQRNDWYDNVTVVLCEIVKSNPIVEQAELVVAAEASAPITPSESNIIASGDPTVSTHNNRRLLIVLIALFAFVLGGFLTSRLLKTTPSSMDNKDEVFEDVKINQKPDLSSEPSKEEPPSTVEKPQSVKVHAEEYQSKNDNTTQTEQKTTFERIVEADNDVSEVYEWIPEEDDMPSNEIQIAADQNLTEAVNNPAKTDTATVTTKQVEKLGITEAAQESNLIHRDNRLSEEECYKMCVNSNSTEKRRENCIKYLKNFKTGQHRSDVEKLFGRNYTGWINGRIRKCSTLNEIKKLQEEHNSLMKEIGMKGSDVDVNISSIAEIQAGRLEKIEKRRQNIRSR